jgi:hypothetical protein
LIAKLGPLQFYAITDNVIAAIKLENVQTANVRLGFNFLFGYTNKNITQKMD